MANTSSFKKTCIAISLAQAFAINASVAGTIFVNNGNDDGNGCTFREAVEIINTGTIDVSQGCLNLFFALGFNDRIEFENRANGLGRFEESVITQSPITITRPMEINLEGMAVQFTGNGDSRLINIDSSDVTINNVTLTGGSTTGNGGAILVTNDANVTISNSTISNSSANRGGGIFSNEDSTLVLNNTTVTGNSSVNAGGGIDLSLRSVITLNNSSVTDNDAGSIGGGIRAAGNSRITLDQNSVISNNEAVGTGGGVVITNGSLTINNSEIVDNKTSATGGGLSLNSTTVDITNSVISKNMANASSGGGIAASSSTVELDNSTVSENYAYEAGGGLFVTSSTLLIDNSTVSGNTNFDNGGGGIAAYQGSTVTLDNSTVSANQTNSSGNLGGGIFADDSSPLTLRNTIVAGNRSLMNSSLGNELAISILNAESTNNLIGDSSLTTDSAFTNSGFLESNIIATSDGDTPTPLSNILAPLADNGGPTFTHAVVRFSPAIDAGDCTNASVDSLDQRGELRTQSIACDIGAFESELSFEVDDSTFFVVPMPNGRAVIFSL